MHTEPTYPFGHLQIPSTELQVPPFKQDQNPPLLHPLSYKNRNREIFYKNKNFFKFYSQSSHLVPENPTTH